MDYIAHLLLILDNENKRVISSVRIPKGETILGLKGQLLSMPNKYSIQINKTTHLDKSDAIDDELNHSCQPNCYVDFDDIKLKALQDIDANEELCINYCATEESLSNPFYCNCKAKNCYIFIAGFKFLNAAQKQQIKNIVSPYLKQKYL